MSVYGVVLTLLLAFPWAFVGVAFVGAAWSAVVGSLGHPGTKAAMACVRSASSGLGCGGAAMPRSGLSADGSHIGSCEDSAPHAA